MQLSVIATVCFAVTTSPPACRNAVVMDGDASIGLGCLIGEAQAITEWKAHSIYAGDQWTIRRVFCAPGGYTPKEPA